MDPKSAEETPPLTSEGHTEHPLNQARFPSPDLAPLRQPPLGLGLTEEHSDCAPAGVTARCPALPASTEIHHTTEIPGGRQTC